MAVNAFSDDRSPIFTINQVESGYAQEVLNETVKYMTSVGCEYHGNLKMKNGKLVENNKKPVVTIFKRPNSEMPQSNNDMKVDLTLTVIASSASVNAPFDKASQ